MLMTGKEIREIREELGVSQVKFAYYLRISFSTLNRWETGKANPDSETLNQLERLGELMKRDKVDKNKVLESLQMVGLASSITLAAVSGLVRLPAIAGLLGPLGAGAGILASLFLKNTPKKKGETNHKKGK